MTMLVDDASVVPHAEDIERVIAIVTNATMAPRPELPNSPLERRLMLIGKWFYAHAIHAALISIATAFLALYLNSRPLADTTYALSLISLLLLLAMCSIAIIGGMMFFLQLRQSVYGPFLNLVQLSAMHDLVHIRELADCPKLAIQYVLLQYKQERNGYERRAGMIAGTIDKVGLFPALAGLVLLISNLMKVPGSTPWGSFFGPLLLAFYFLSLASSQMTYKMDRVIALLEFAAQAK